MAERNARYSKAYAILAAITPIPADCGKLCGARCCSGDSEAGMILFPGEAEFLAGATFLSVRKREMSGITVDFAVCTGRCSRAMRPLACRIFPLAPDWNGSELRVIADARARWLCPLLEAEEMISQGFREAVRDAFTVLLGDAEIARMLEAYSRMLSEYRRFQ